MGSQRMSETAITEAFMAHLAAMAGLPAVAWPNGAQVPTTPRLEMQTGPAGPRSLTLAGASDTDLMYQVTVVTKAGEFTTASNALIEAVVSHFAFGQPVGAAKVRKRPDIGPAIQDGIEYRVPITIRLRAFL